MPDYVEPLSVDALWCSHGCASGPENLIAPCPIAASKENNMKNNKSLYLVTVAFFGLAFVNIHFSILGILCMTLPFVLLVRDK